MSEMMEERVLTPEMREKLLGDMPFNSDSTIEFTPKHYLRKDEKGDFILPEEYRPVFILKGMTKPQRQKGRKLVIKMSEELKEDDQGHVVDLTRLNVIGWRNMFDLGTMKEFKFNAETDGGCEKKLFDSIPVSIVGQIFFEQCRISGILDTDKLSLES